MDINKFLDTLSAIAIPTLLFFVGVLFMVISTANNFFGIEVLSWARRPLFYIGLIFLLISLVLNFIPGLKYTEMGNTDAPGNDIDSSGQLSNKSLTINKQRCIKKCENTKQCKAVVFQVLYNVDSCWLKSDYSNQQYGAQKTLIILK